MNNLGAYGSDSDSETDASAAKKPTVQPPKKKRITIALPSLPDDPEEDERPTKKPRLQSGGGGSSLFSMLPSPQKKLPAQTSSISLPKPKAPAVSSSLAFVPTSVSHEPAVSVEKPRDSLSTATASEDFFSLGSSSTKSTSKTKTDSLSSSSFSSAPSIPTFEPPEPTPTDEYPGYYQLPSGAWAAYDPQYYASFMKKWQKEYDSHVRALEKGKVKGFEDVEKAPMEEADAHKEMERAKVEVKLREERKALTRDAGDMPELPRMKITAAKQSGIARQRHQLATMLTEAYTNREALEEKIAQGRRNRKEAGNKYGF